MHVFYISSLVQLTFFFFSFFTHYSTKTMVVGTAHRYRLSCFFHMGCLLFHSFKLRFYGSFYIFSLLAGVGGGGGLEIRLLEL